MSRTEREAAKIETAKILEDKGIKTGDDIYAMGEDAAELYEELKAGVLEEFDIEMEELDEILDELLEE